MFTLNCKGRLLVAEQPLVMGILNITPDSFYKESRVSGDGLLQQAEQMIQEGASILDIGGQSTRPGSTRIDSEEELRRVVPAIQAVAHHFPETILSIDTYHASVAREAVNAGASIVNDISGGTIDATMIATVGELKVPYVCTHIKGTPETMQQEPVYEDLLTEMMDFFTERIGLCQQAGITDIIIDPGIGFGKTFLHNFQLIRQLAVFKNLGKPLVLGVSRKGFIYRTLGVTAEDALNGTTVLNTIGLMNGAGILRVHDVKEAKECIQMLKAVSH